MWSEDFQVMHVSMFAWWPLRACVWILSIHLCAVPLQEGLAQSLLSWWGPLHSAQPCTEELQRLCLCWVPVLHVTLHLDHGPHSNHWPSTGETAADMNRQGNGWRWSEEGLERHGQIQMNWSRFWKDTIRRCKGNREMQKEWRHQSTERK